MTEAHGAELGVKLKDLLIVGADKIPAMAEIYSGSASALGATANQQGDAFYQHETSGGGTASRFLGSWTTLRDELEDIFTRTRANLNDTAATVLDVINDYANHDEAAAQGLRDAVAEHNGNAYNEGGVLRRAGVEHNGSTYNETPNLDGDKNLPVLPPIGDGMNPVPLPAGTLKRMDSHG